MLKTKMIPIFVLTFVFSLLLSAGTNARVEANFDSTADREAKMAERESQKAANMQDMEERKAQMKLEREEKMLQRQEELEAKKLMMMEERETKKAERMAFRCEMIQEKVDLQLEKMDRNTTRIDEMKAKWAANLEKLNSKGYDLPEIDQLETDLQTFFTLLDEYKALQAQLNADIASTQLSACNAELTAEESKELAQTLKDQLQARRDALALKRTEFKDFYNEVIKADILEVRLAIKNSLEEDKDETSENVENESEVEVAE